MMSSWVNNRLQLSSLSVVNVLLDLTDTHTLKPYDSELMLGSPVEVTIDSD